eukprot:m.342522 g.342522  ORF g.342522 m.342522 type:complete len:127 (+) comp21485_c0_seq1:144-524(+)
MDRPSSSFLRAIFDHLSPNIWIQKIDTLIQSRVLKISDKGDAKSDYLLQLHVGLAVVCALFATYFHLRRIHPNLGDAVFAQNSMVSVRINIAIAVGIVTGLMSAYWMLYAFVSLVDYVRDNGMSEA